MSGGLLEFVEVSEKVIDEIRYLRVASVLAFPVIDRQHGSDGNRFNILICLDQGGIILTVELSGQIGFQQRWGMIDRYEMQ